MWAKKTSSGIGFIEVMTAVVIISIASLGILMGAVHARGQLHALQVKERATEEAFELYGVLERTYCRWSNVVF